MTTRKTRAQDSILAQNYKGFEPHGPKTLQCCAGIAQPQFEWSTTEVGWTTDGPVFRTKIGPTIFERYAEFGSNFGTNFWFLDRFLVPFGGRFWVHMESKTETFLGRPLEGSEGS